MEGRRSLQKFPNEIAQVHNTLNEEVSWRNMREQGEQELRKKKTTVEELQKALDQEWWL